MMQEEGSFNRGSEKALSVRRLNREILMRSEVAEERRRERTRSDDVALEGDRAARGTSGNHHQERVCRAEVAGGTGREADVDEAAERGVRREGPGGEGGRGSAVRRLLYGGQTPELLRRVRSYATGVGAA